MRKLLCFAFRSNGVDAMLLGDGVDILEVSIVILFGPIVLAASSVIGGVHQEMDMKMRFVLMDCTYQLVTGIVEFHDLLCDHLCSLKSICSSESKLRTVCLSLTPFSL